MTLIRTEPFVPLISAAAAASGGERSGFQATVISQPEQPAKFQSAEASATISGGAGATARGSQCEPRVSVQRDGDRVSGIRIQCSCGEVIDLACVYDAVAKA
jgi:hypothetical protein